ncbi:MAG: Gfo/Idh/MocA family oxidoreductase [Saprospiraceae bacterium]|nr:Gfo/Idh/MocA family oxidoreductase [Saprospiraceae bacterium]
MRKTFALIGSNGYIASRHVEAIAATGGQLVATLDPKPLSKENSTHFTDEAAFFKHVEEQAVDYVSICSPSFLHAKHAKKAMEAGCNVICEKPLALRLDDFQALKALEKKHQKNCFAVFQFRQSTTIQSIKNTINPHEPQKVELFFQGYRPTQYWESWKGNVEQSGGILTNIGIHYFDIVAFWLGYDWTYLNYSEAMKKSTGTAKIDGIHEFSWLIQLEDEEQPTSRYFKLNNELIPLHNDQQLYNKTYLEFTSTEKSLLHQAHLTHSILPAFNT